MAHSSRRSLAARFFTGVVYTLWLTGALAVGTGLGLIKDSEVAGSLIEQTVKQKKPQQVFGSVSTPADDLTILILGCDEDRYYGGKQILNRQARSDMIMVARMDFNRKSIGAMSIPRDLRVRYKGDRMKINALHAVGGPEASQEGIEDLLPGVKIDRVVVLNFEAFQKMVDMLGGVEVFVPKRMKYDDVRGGLHIDLEKGRHKLSGYQAMGFVRYRKGNDGRGDSDFERQKRQKDLMLALKESMTANFTRVPAILDETISLSGNSFNAAEIASLMLFAQSIDAQNIRMGQLPVVEVSGSYDLLPNEVELPEALRTYRLLSSGSNLATL